MRAPLLLGAVEAAAFPRRAAGDDCRHAPTLQRTGDVEVADAVETQLDHVAVRRRVARRHAGRPSCRPVTVSQSNAVVITNKNASSTGG